MLKKAYSYILVPIFAFQSIILVSQEYFPFPNENAQWGIEFEWDGENATEYTNLEIIGDTNIQEKVYSILKQSHAIYRPYYLIDWEYFDKPSLFIREENKRIYYYDIFDLKEYVYYDFNLNVNDTFIFKNNDSLLVIKEIELYGRKGFRLKKLNNPYLGNYYTVDWLQGIGCLKGLIHPIGFSGGNTSLTCFRDGFFNPLDCSTFDQILYISEPTASKVCSIFPNPSNNILNVQADDKISKIKIRLLNGQIIKELDPYSKKCEIDISDIKNGIYFVQIISKGNQKILKLIKV
jgi:Secretion system C-terminal sorting domain